MLPTAWLRESTRTGCLHCGQSDLRFSHSHMHAPQKLWRHGCRATGLYIKSQQIEQSSCLATSSEVGEPPLPPPMAELEPEEPAEPEEPEAVASAADAEEEEGPPLALALATTSPAEEEPAADGAAPAGWRCAVRRAPRI